MNTARIFHSATALANGQVMIAGGFNTSAVTTTFEIYDPILNAFIAQGTMAPDVHNPTPARAGHTATLLNSGRVMIAGGSTFQNATFGGELYVPGYPAPPGLHPPQ
jgi:hypothetical protein